jgi:Sulfotransferase family
MVAGLGRSGSTLLDRMLDQLPGYCGVGELTYVWIRGVLENDLCGCGVAFYSCPFWTAVGEAGFGGWDTVDAPSIIELKAQVQRNRYIPAFIVPAAAPGFHARQRPYSEILGRLYQAIAEVSGASVVVDTSKIVCTAYAAWRTEGVDLQLIHLVRDCRAVAYSWTKTVRRPEAVSKESYLPTYSSVRVGLEYDVYNAAVEALGRLGVPTMRLRYEDFVADPKTTLKRIGKFTGLATSDADLNFLAADGFQMDAGHNVAGNPMKFQTGRIPIKRDDAWRTHLGDKSKRTVSLLSAPMSLRYGYPMSAR